MTPKGQDCKSIRESIILRHGGEHYNLSVWKTEEGVAVTLRSARATKPDSSPHNKTKQRGEEETVEMPTPIGNPLTHNANIPLSNSPS